MSYETQIRLIADRFVEWQGPYGLPNPETFPFMIREDPASGTNFHCQTFITIGLYAAYNATRDLRYKEAADRYMVAYMAALREPFGRLPDS